MSSAAVAKVAAAPKPGIEQQREEHFAAQSVKKKRESKGEISSGG